MSDDRHEAWVRKFNSPESVKVHIDNLAQGYEKLHWRTTLGPYQSERGMDNPVQADHYLSLCQTFLELWFQPRDETKEKRLQAIAWTMNGLILDGRTNKWLGGVTVQDCDLIWPYSLNTKVIRAFDQLLQCDKCYAIMDGEKHFGEHLVSKHMGSLRYYFEL